MTSRSSRFFVVLLHLVGVSRFRPYRSPHQGASTNSLVGGTSTMMQPYQELSVQQYTHHYHGTLTRQNMNDTSVWIQDADTRDSCIGPYGWSDCGDATQWILERVTPSPPHRLRMGLFGVKEAEKKRRQKNSGWRLCLVEQHDEPMYDNDGRRRTTRRQQPVRACLAAKPQEKLVVVEERQWRRNHIESLWQIDPETSSLQSLLRSEDGEKLCLARTSARRDASSLKLESCDSYYSHEHGLVKISLMQYQAVRVPLEDELRLPMLKSDQGNRVDDRSAQSQHYASHHAHAYPSKAPSLAPRPVPYHRDQAHSSAIEPHDVLPYLNKNVHGQVPQALLKDSNPILLTSRIHRQMMDSGKKAAPQLSSSTAGLKSRNKIAVHPYLQSARNEIWKDPSTGLEYATDLSNQLNRNRKEQGRHSLMGVGQYVKGFVIKVYGIAFYVSKRDALADPALEPFAGLSADELRQRQDFYQVLRTMGTSSGNFERTLVLKTNMQLSADTMRSSLHADWSQLTDEMKDMLLNSSMEPRPADSKMLEWIQSPENPSRCSCSSVAPPHFNADPNCCARGTELAFTWLKTGDLEVRMNGRIMDTFPRKDMAEGIFYEYLRMDDPISTDFLSRVVDGFPFLLAPLAQVKGVHLNQGHGASKSHGNPVVRAAFGLFESAQSGAAAVAGIIHMSAGPILSQFGHAARSVGDLSKAAYKDLESRKDLLVGLIASFPDFVMGLVSGENSAPILDSVSEWVSANITPTDDELRVVRRDSLGRAFGYPLSRWFSDAYQAPDEIGPMKIDPTLDKTRRVFLAFVHIYLLLLFIASFPGSYNNRTRLIVRDNMVQLDRADNGSLSSTDDSETAEKEFGSVSDMTYDGDDDMQRRKSTKQVSSRSRRALRPSNVHEICDDDLGSRLKKKSLSYFL